MVGWLVGLSERAGTDAKRDVRMRTLENPFFFMAGMDKWMTVACVRDNGREFPMRQAYLLTSVLPSYPVVYYIPTYLYQIKSNQIKPNQSSESDFFKIYSSPSRACLISTEPRSAPPSQVHKEIHGAG